MRIFHFSDPHAGGPAEDWRAYFDKRWVGVFNYRFRRRFRHDLGMLRNAVDYLMAHRADVAVCTGDLTSTGQPGEFAQVREILRPLRDSAIPIIYLPGNHDCYVKRPACVAAMTDMVHWLTRGDYEFAALPQVRTIGGCDFLLLNTSRPSNLLCSWGFVSRADSRYIEEFCRTPKQRPRILVGQYTLYEEHPFLRIRHRLFGQRKLQELLENGAIDLALCGHVHRPYRHLTPKGYGENCAGSVTLNGSMTQIDCDPAGGRFQFEQIHLVRA